MRTCRCDAPATRTAVRRVAAAAALALGLAATRAARPPRRIRGRAGRRCAGLGRPRRVRSSTRSRRRPGRASRTAWSSFATASSPASGTSAAPGRTRRRTCSRRRNRSPSTLVGIAQDDGDLRIGDSASRWIPQWRGTPPQAVTVRDLLSMDSGRQWSAFTDYVRLLAARDRTAFAIGLGQAAAPGHGLGVQQLGCADARPRAAEGDRHGTSSTFAKQRLFAPLGMTHTTMTTDRAGNAQMFEGMRSTCRDLARFGVLMLDRGAWGGRQIVSSGWVAQATGRVVDEAQRRLRLSLVAQPRGRPRRRRSRRPACRQARARREAGRLVPGAPDGMYWALGLGNQIIQVDPGTSTVVVRLGTAEPIPTAADVRARRGERGRHRGGRPRASVSTPPPGAGAARSEKLTRPASR